jgi:membrane protease YdiL (CAAX protease family)
MSTLLTVNTQVKSESVREAGVSIRPVYRIVLLVLFLACALAVILLGANYYKLFPTNGSLPYNAGLAVVFLGGAVLLKRNTKLAPYGQVAYAFFILAAINLVSILLGGYNEWFLLLFRVVPGTNAGQALSKVFEVGLIVAPILVLSKVSGADLGALFIRRGNLKAGLAFGSLVFFNFATSALIFVATGYSSPGQLGNAILWGLVFSFANGFSEELWLRGLFMKKLQPLIGFAGTLLLTSIWFALLHLFSVSYLPPAAVPIFLVNTLTLGLGCGYLMLKTNSIWGAVLIHAAADLFLFIAMLAIR